MKYLISCIITLLFSCASTNIVKLSNHNYPEKNENCNINVFSQQPQNLKYEEIVLLSARSGGNIFSNDSVEGIISELKRKACKYGADAIIIKDAKEGGMNWVGPKTRAEVSATAIKLL